LLFLKSKKYPVSPI